MKGFEKYKQGDTVHAYGLQPGSADYKDLRGFVTDYRNGGFKIYVPVNKRTETIHSARLVLNRRLILTEECIPLTERFLTVVSGTTTFFGI